jgi:AraC family transcriptional regulator
MYKYDYFLNQIPNEISQKVEKQILNEIAIFKPRTYVGGKTIESIDFHIIIPTEQPPDSYINGKLKSFQKGKVIVINPEESLLCTKECASKQYISMLIKPELVQRIAEEMDFLGELRFAKLQNPYSGELIQIIKNIEKESSRHDKLPLIIDCLSVQVVALLLREFSTNIKKYPINSPDCDVYISRAIEYMETFFSGNISVGDICNEINVSLFHFIRTFKQKVGVSPHQYLMEVRINRSKELLSHKQHTIAEVAMLCGFITLSHFSTTFKSLMMISPSEYRKLVFQANPTANEL